MGPSDWGYRNGILAMGPWQRGYRNGPWQFVPCNMFLVLVIASSHWGPRNGVFVCNIYSSTIMMGLGFGGAIQRQGSWKECCLFARKEQGPHQASVVMVNTCSLASPRCSDGGLAWVSAGLWVSSRTGEAQVVYPAPPPLHSSSIQHMSQVGIDCVFSAHVLQCRISGGGARSSDGVA